MKKTLSIEDLVEHGNLGQLESNGTGWIIGFSDWCRSERNDLRHVERGHPLSDLAVKWFEHRAGDPSGQKKPISSGRTISILVGAPGDFCLEFSLSPDFPEERLMRVPLQICGDFAIWGSGVYHRAFGIVGSKILTLRWEEG